MKKEIYALEKVLVSIARASNARIVKGSFGLSVSAKRACRNKVALESIFRSQTWLKIYMRQIGVAQSKTFEQSEEILDFEAVRNRVPLLIEEALGQGREDSCMLNCWLKSWLKRANFSSSPASKPIKIINSSQVEESAEKAAELNAKRAAQLAEYAKSLRRTRQSYARLAQAQSTKDEIDAAQRKEKSAKRLEAWQKYVESVKKRLNPDVPALQAAGLIPRRDPERRAEKAKRGAEALAKAHRQAILMRRKYLSFLAEEVVPGLVNAENLDAKIQAALDNPVSYNLTADAVVQTEKRVKEKLRSVRVDMEEELETASPLPQLQ